MQKQPPVLWSNGHGRDHHGKYLLGLWSGSSFHGDQFFTCCLIRNELHLSALACVVADDVLATIGMHAFAYVSRRRAML